MKKTLWTAALIVALGLAGNVSAVTLTPDDLALPGDFGATNPYGWDWDQDKPIGSTTVGGAPGYDVGSWYSDVQGSAAGGGRDYTALRIDVGGMFGGTVTMADLNDISYWTYLESGTIDWQIKIYTKPTITATTWYEHRFNFDRPTNAAGSWQQSSTSSGLDINWIAGTGGNVFPAAYTLSDASAAYATEEVWFIDIIAGYATNGPAVYSYLDGVEITVNNQTIGLNLEANAPVPEPATMTLLGLGLLGLGIRSRKRKSA